MGQNRVSLSISDEDMTAINGAIMTLQEKLLPHLQNLSPDEKKSLLKLGDRSIAFVNKASDWVTLNPNLLPPYSNLDELKLDLSAIKLLSPIEKSLQTIVNGLEDTIMLAGSEVYSESLVIYGFIKAAARANVEGAQEAYEDLRVRFPGRGATTSEEEVQD